MRAAPQRHGVRVARRLTLTFALLITLLLIVGAGALTVTSMANGLQRRVLTELEPEVRENLRVRERANRMHRAVRTYLLTGDETELVGYERAREQSFAALAAARRDTTSAVRRNLSAQHRELRAYVTVADRQAKATPGSDEANRLTVQAARRFATFDATNRRLELSLTREMNRLEARADTILRTSIVGIGVLLAVGGGVAVLMSVHTTRALTRPLRSTAQTLGRLAAGEHSARARETGPEEIRAVARSVNVLADESDRLRGVERERTSLSQAARELGIRIRDRLDVDYVLDSACGGIGEILAADYVFVLLAEEGGSAFPLARVWSAERGLLPDAEARAIPSLPADVVRDHYRRGTVWLVADLPRYLSANTPIAGAPGSFGKVGMPTENRAAAAALGLESAVVTPIGVGEEPIGAVCVARTSGRAWRPVEVEIAESMASGVGRALHTSLLYEKETRLVEKLRALDKAKSDFLSTVSHELRTPLTSIVGYVELLKDEETGSLTPPQRRMLDVVDRNANRLRALIEDLLTLSRIESGTFGSMKKPVDLHGLVASAADAIRPAAETASVTLETHCPSGPLVLEADGDQLDRVLMNLLSNAVKFTPEGGKVTVGADARNGEAVLTVSDNGIGIPAAEQERLFQRFFRASNATDAAIPGTGLGLTIVHTIVANHGGEMEVRSEEGRGTTFTARFPITGENGAASC
ncbi:ATP-binding protein [Streptomyces neyagawaensis]|uniref:ATP-binding protein n=1 Tax=Streptomyces neyagawaensis TaxID=42238 RepID=UPI000AFE0233|nr:ATP-binding protein [Streptomyces neyagawaensis]MCL6733655.1 ATP-binding protein [Streptomyces neyagawaensis]MDE1683884.1 ATP-binding protein [Streptomyces neyagawaensis]